MATTTEGPRRRRRRKKGSSSFERRREDGPTNVDDLPDHLFEDVLLRLATPLCLARAAATCRRWRRLVTDAGFLHRFRSLHEPPYIVGGYRTVDRCRTIFVPSSPAMAGLGIDSSLDFLPDRPSWELADSRGTLLLLSRNNGTCERGRCSNERVYHGCGCRQDLLVCDPLTRRHQGILWPRKLHQRSRTAFLLDGADAGRRIGMSNFRVLVTVSETGINGSPYVFSAGSDGDWRRLAAAALPLDNMTLVGRANGSVYLASGDRVVAIDGTTGKFAGVRFPSYVWGSSAEKSKTCRVIGGGEDGTPRVVRVMKNELKVFAQVRCPGFVKEWVLEKLLSLPEATMALPGRLPDFFREEAMIIGGNDRYVLLTPTEKTWVFTVDLETMQVAVEHGGSNQYTDGEVYTYELPWAPPAFSRSNNIAMD